MDSALRQRKLRPAAIDVLMQEHPAPDHPVFNNPFITISPYNAGLTEECAMRMGISTAQNILDCFECRRDWFNLKFKLLRAWLRDRGWHLWGIFRR